jgi:hypothetical protein
MPQPWSIDPRYGFLLIPSTIQMLLYVPALIGGYYLWRRSPVPALLLIYALIVILFCSVYVEFQGSRQRMLLTFVWVWMEYHFFYQMLRPAAQSQRPTEPELSEAIT